MRSSFTPEEVDRIENKAYEVGISVGERQERERIIALIESSEVGGYRDADYIIALIKGSNE